MFTSSGYLLVFARHKQVRQKHYLRLARYMCFLIGLTVLGVYEGTGNSVGAHFYMTALRESLVRRVCQHTASGMAAP